MTSLQFLKEKERDYAFRMLQGYIENEENFLGEQNYINKIAISIYKYWLSEEEARNEIKTYPLILRKIEKNQYDSQEVISLLREHGEKELKLLSFYIDLYKKFSLFGFTARNKKACEYKSFKKYIKECEKSIREESFLTLFIPESECFIVGNYDFTPIIFFKEEEKCREVIISVKQASLFTLN